MRVQDSAGSPPPLPTGKGPTYTLPHPVVMGGMPGWQLAVIVANAALLGIDGHRGRSSGEDRAPGLARTSGLDKSSTEGRSKSQGALRLLHRLHLGPTTTTTSERTSWEAPTSA